MSIRGMSTLNINDYNQPLMILDGLVYTGDLNKPDASNIT